MEFYLVPVIAAALMGLALWVWAMGVRQYKSTGSCIYFMINGRSHAENI